MLAGAFLLTIAVYWPGLNGPFLFDDYPNIVDNQGVQPHDASMSSLVRAALSSPSSEFKRPMASLSFAANYMITGLDPYWMKWTNLFIHLLNGLLVFLLVEVLLETSIASDTGQEPAADPGLVAVLIATGWMLLPINLTAVLYVVQRMESMANLFVLLGLLGYVCGRRHMLLGTVESPAAEFSERSGSGFFRRQSRGMILCILSITIPTAIGLLAKETAIMLPLYAASIEWTMFRFRKPQPIAPPLQVSPPTSKRDPRIVGLFLLMLVLPMIMGLAWLLPAMFRPETWATRDFTLQTRLFSEARIVVDYIAWTLIPTPDALSFYHDDFRISTGLLAPATTLACVLALAAIVASSVWFRRRAPLVALGMMLFLGSQLLTGTIIPLELIYEHRNYFASFGLLLVIVPLLAVRRSVPFALPRHVLLAGLLICWAGLTGLTAHAWGDPLRLAEELAGRAPLSPRAQYELGRTYIIYSHYDPTSPFTRLAYGPLEKSAALPGSSILPEQALIFMNARMELPLKDVWWESLVSKLKARKPGVQDESSLGALTQCVREGRCDLPKDRMIAAFLAALDHPQPGARLLATYGDYAWNVLDDRTLGQQLTQEAVETQPDEPAYRVTLVRMLVVRDQIPAARRQMTQLERLNIAGRLKNEIAGLDVLLKNRQ